MQSMQACEGMVRSVDKVLEELNNAVTVVGNWIEEIKNLKHVYRKPLRYVVYCPQCLEYRLVSYYSYRKAVEGMLRCDRCRKPMKPLDDVFKVAKLRRLEMLRELLQAEPCCA